MAETPSTMLPLGTKAADFNLLDTVSQHRRSLQQVKSEKATVIMFLCNHCPYVKHIQRKLVETVRQYQNQGISFVAISSNDVATYPQDGPTEMQQEALQYQYSFPYLYDETQEVAKAYQAACTPDFYVFDKNLLCIYRGRFDGSTPGNGLSVTGKDLTDVLDQVLNDKPVSQTQKPSVGCNIKWKKR